MSQVRLQPEGVADMSDKEIEEGLGIGECEGPQYCVEWRKLELRGWQ